MVYFEKNTVKNTFNAAADRMEQRILNKLCLHRLLSCQFRYNHHKAVKLHYVSVPTATDECHQDNNKPPLVIVHGLFGHHGNWNSVAKALQQKLRHRVIVADLRNHGNSPHIPTMSIEDMASDLENMIPEWTSGSNKCLLLGHSLGGKVAAYLALKKPHLIEKLILEDIVPKAYSMSRYIDLGRFVRIMRESTLTGDNVSDVRREVDKQLTPVVSDVPTRQFLLTNLVEKDGKVQWRLNLAAIEQFIPVLFGFPADALEKQYNGETLEIWGENTIHLNPKEDYQYLKQLFPKIKIQMIKDCGHWVHAQKPKEFMDAVVDFLLSK